MKTKSDELGERKKQSKSDNKKSQQDGHIYIWRDKLRMQIPEFSACRCVVIFYIYIYKYEWSLTGWMDGGMETFISNSFQFKKKKHHH